MVSLRYGTSRCNSDPGTLGWNHVSHPHHCLPLTSYTLLLLTLAHQPLSWWTFIYSFLSAATVNLSGLCPCFDEFPIIDVAYRTLNRKARVSLHPWHTAYLSSLGYSPSSSFILGPAAGPLTRCSLFVEEIPFCSPAHS